jgi:hypothetical protein
MKRRGKVFKRAKIVMLSALLITSLSVPCSAADAGFKDLFENALYGGLAGALVGGACLAFASKPGDHLDYISIGAASGVLVGVGYTVVKGSKSLVSIENGDVKFAIPTITPEFKTASVKGQSSVMMKAELISGTF